MAERTEPKERRDGEEELRGSFAGSLLIGLFMVAVWIWVLFIYLDRL